MYVPLVGSIWPGYVGLFDWSPYGGKSVNHKIKYDLEHKEERKNQQNLPKRFINQNKCWYSFVRAAIYILTKNSKTISVTIIPISQPC